MRQFLTLVLGALLVVTLANCSLSVSSEPTTSDGGGASTSVGDQPVGDQSPETVMAAVGCDGTLNTKAEAEKGVVAIYNCQGTSTYELDNVRFFDSAGYTQAFLQHLRKEAPSTVRKFTIITGEKWAVITGESDRIAAAVDFGGEIFQP